MFEQENIGHFWGMIETRPYMRARNRKITILMDLGRYTEAIKECEKLYKKFNEYSAFMLFPMAIMYFKKGDYKKCMQMNQYQEHKITNEVILLE